MINRDNARRHIAWDLETTGLAWTDEITVSGIWLPGDTGTADLVLNTGGAEVETDRFESRLTACSGATVNVTAAPDETDLLETMRQLLFRGFDREYCRLTAYNGDSWKGGFDLPFVRTQCLKRGVDWVFDGIEFCDLWEPITKRLNTTVAYPGGTDAVNSLAGAHEILFGQETTAVVAQDVDDDHPWYHDRRYDPFTESVHAVEYYNRGDFLPVLKHNLADIHRTWELGELVRTVVPPDDIDTKKL